MPTPDHYKPHPYFAATYENDDDCKVIAHADTRAEAFREAEAFVADCYDDPDCPALGPIKVYACTLEAWDWFRDHGAGYAPRLFHIVGEDRALHIVPGTRPE